MQKFLFLDVGDTLLKLKKNPYEIYYQVLAKYDILEDSLDPNLLKSIFKFSWMELEKQITEDYKDRYSTHKDGFLGWWRELIMMILSKLNINRTPDNTIFQEIFSKFDEIETWEIEPSFFDLKDHCKLNNIGLGIISNWDLRLRKLLQNLNLSQYFGPIIISAEFGYEKPSLKIFEEGKRLVDKKNIQFYYIGDKKHLDYDPPRLIGWKSYLKTAHKLDGVESVEKLIDVVKFIE